jgi:acetyl-CoA carboxylase carboxyltransferase component
MVYGIALRGLGKVLIKAGKTLKKSTQRQSDLRNARARIRAAERRRGEDPNKRKHKQHESKRMKELIKQGKLGEINKEAKKGTGIFIGQKNPGRGVGRWDYSDK